MILQRRRRRFHGHPTKALRPAPLSGMLRRVAEDKTIKAVFCESIRRAVMRLRRMRCCARSSYSVKEADGHLLLGHRGVRRFITCR